MEKLNSTIRWGHDTLVSIFHFLKLPILTQDFIFMDSEIILMILILLSPPSIPLSLPPSSLPSLPVYMFKGPGNETLYFVMSWVREI